MFLRRIPIAPRAALGFGLVALLVLLLGVFSLMQMMEMRHQAEEVDNKWLPSVVTIGELSQDILRLRAVTLRMIVTRDPEQKENSLRLAEELRGLLAKAQAEYEELLRSEKEREGYARFKHAEEIYLEDQSQVMELIRKSQYDQALAVLNGVMNQHADEMAVELVKLSHYNQANAARSAERADQVFHSARNLVIAMMVLAVIATLVLAFVLTRSIVQPLSAAVQAAEIVASGDLTQRISDDGNDEPARLMEAMKAMQGSLRDTLQSISDSSNQLASASEELHAVTEDATRVLHQQNTEIEQAATGVNQMTAAVEEVASNAASTSEASRDADRSAQQGREQVRQTVESISQLADDVTTTSAEIELLAERVREISKVLDVIGSIAEQTNLLALNAAIEAARAGDAGRGFAVVADEVRALAHRTQQSTQEIEQMINGIQQGTDQAVKAMQSSNGRARSTLEVAQAAGQALDGIAQAISSINERNQAIAGASEEQARVEHEVDQILVNIRELAVQTSAGAHETNAASQELSRLAVDLNQMVGRFKV